MKKVILAASLASFLVLVLLYWTLTPGRRQPAEGAPVEEWERMVALNVTGLLYVSHAALPHLLKSAEDGAREVADRRTEPCKESRTARLGLRDAPQAGVVLRRKRADRQLRIVRQQRSGAALEDAGGDVDRPVQQGSVLREQRADQ